jgi:outer membrane protein TolC
MIVFRPRSALVLLLLPMVAFYGCAQYQYEAKPLQTKQLEAEFMSRSPDDLRLNEHLTGYGYPVKQWPLSEWDLGALALAAYYFHPEIQVAIADYRKAIIQAETARQRINPGVEIPFEHHSDTSDGKSPWTIGLLFNFILERPAKRLARYELADAGINVSRININATAWNIYSGLRRQYFNYQSVLNNQKQLQIQENITEEVLKLLTRRLELGEASEFEMSSIQLDLQRARLALTNHKVSVVDARHALAGSLGLPVTALDNMNIASVDTDIMNNITDFGLSELQSIALTQRLDIQQALAQYSAHEAALKLEIEKQYPDVNLSPGFIFDQSDKIWALGAAWILPLFHPLNEGPIREALAERERKQSEFLALQARVINEVAMAEGRLQAQQSALLEARQLLEETQERYRQMQRQFDLGYADHLQLSRNMLEVAAVEQAVAELTYSVIKSAGQLEDALQYPLFVKQAYQYLFDAGGPPE